MKLRGSYDITVTYKDGEKMLIKYASKELMQTGINHHGNKRDVLKIQIGDHTKEAS